MKSFILTGVLAALSGVTPGQTSRPATGTPAARGHFDLPRHVQFTAPGRVRAIADMNLDGLPDFLFTLGGRVQIWTNAGNLVFNKQTVLRQSSADDVLVGDVTADGRPDVILATEYGVEVYPGDGAGGVASGIDVHPGDLIVRIGNLDADPSLEIVGYDRFTGALVTWNWSGGTFEEVGTVDLSPFPVFEYEVIDFDMDGLDDVVLTTTDRANLRHEAVLLPAGGTNGGLVLDLPVLAANPQRWNIRKSAPAGGVFFVYENHEDDDLYVIPLYSNGANAVLGNLQRFLDGTLASETVTHDFDRDWCAPQFLRTPAKGRQPE